MAPLLLRISSLSGIRIILHLNVQFIIYFQLHICFWGLMALFYFRALYGSVAEWLGRGLQNLLQQFESARNLLILAALAGILLCMKYSQLLGIIAVVILAAVCYMPWSSIAEKNIAVTGMSAPGTMFGEPGLMHFVLGVPLILFFIIPKIWAKRINVFIGAINLAWSIRNYILLTTCFMGECPHLKPGLILSMALSAFILVMTFFPRIKVS